MGQDTVFTRNFFETLRSRLEVFTPFIQILIGPRQVGKTTAVWEIIHNHAEKARYINLENIGPDPHEKIRFEWKRINKLRGHKIIALDEIQNVPDWAVLIKELYDEVRPQKELSVVILGSSSLDLLLRGEESLLGRFEIVRAPHWSFQEIRDAFGWDLERYLQFGGYPDISQMIKDNSTDAKRRVQLFIRDAIIEPVITRDILSLQTVMNTALFRQILTVSLSLPCEEISFAKFLGQLSDKGSTATVKSYLELLEKGLLIKLLYRFSEGKIRQRTSSPKIIPLAPALIHAFNNPDAILNDAGWFGHVFEASVISRIAEISHFDLYYWSNSREDVDLVIKDYNSIIGVEIKSGTIHDHRGLRAFKKEYPRAKTLMIDRVTGEEILSSRKPEKVIEKLVSLQN
jgi:uncharacterized protein